MDRIYAKRVVLIENRKSDYHDWILHIQITWGTKFQLKLTILIFRTKFIRKWYFWSKNEKLSITIDFYIFESAWVNSTIEFCIFELVLGTKIQLKVAILIFWTKFAQKGYFRSNCFRPKVPFLDNFCEYQNWILHILISLKPFS